MVDGDKDSSPANDVGANSGSRRTNEAIPTADAGKELTAGSPPKTKVKNANVTTVANPTVDADKELAIAGDSPKGDPIAENSETRADVRAELQKAKLLLDALTLEGETLSNVKSEAELKVSGTTALLDDQSKEIVNLREAMDLELEALDIKVGKLGQLEKNYKELQDQRDKEVDSAEKATKAREANDRKMKELQAKLEALETEDRLANTIKEL